MSLASVIAAKKARVRGGEETKDGRCFSRRRSTCEFPRGRSHCSVDLADERAMRKEGREEGRMFSRAFVARVWISSRLLSSLECLLYDEREERRCTSAAEIVLAAGPLSESIFASLGAYFRAYLHAFDNAGAAGAPVWDRRAPRARCARHIRQRSSRDLLAFLLCGCHRDLFL